MAECSLFWDDHLDLMKSPRTVTKDMYLHAYIYTYSLLRIFKGSSINFSIFAMLGGGGESSCMLYKMPVLATILVCLANQHLYSTLLRRGYVKRVLSVCL